MASDHSLDFELRSVASHDRFDSGIPVSETDQRRSFELYAVTSHPVLRSLGLNWNECWDMDSGDTDRLHNLNLIAGQSPGDAS